MRKLSSTAIWAIIFGVILAVQAYSAFGQTSRGDERRAAAYSAANDAEANAAIDDEAYPGAVEIAPTVSGLYAADGVNSHLAAMRIIWREAAERETNTIRKRTPPILRQARRKAGNRDHN